MKVTYFLEVVSSWCHWVEPVWAELKQRYEGKVEFSWKVALMRPEDFPVSGNQCDWFYRRSGTLVRSPYMLNSAWLESTGRANYSAPNLVAEAGKDFGFIDDRLRLALSNAAVREGRKIGDMGEAVSVATQVTGVDAAKLRARAESLDIMQRVQTSTNEFYGHQISQRPAFVLEDPIGDKAVFSGLVRIDPLAATIDAMLADTAGYAAYKAHFGVPPSQ